MCNLSLFLSICPPVRAPIAGVHAGHPLTIAKEDFGSNQLPRFFLFETIRDPVPPEHWFDPDKLRQVALAARPDSLAALKQIHSLNWRSGPLRHTAQRLSPSPRSYSSTLQRENSRTIEP